MTKKTKAPDYNDPVVVHNLHWECFAQLHCDYLKASGEQCRIVPAWIDARSGQQLCYVHKAMRWNVYLEEARNASAVHAGG